MSEDDVETRLARLESDLQGLVSQHQASLQRIADLEATIKGYEDERERLLFRVGKLESILPDEQDPYEELTREQRVQRIQDYALERAYASGGRYEIDYDEVQWSVIDGEPSTGYCYKLLRLAGEADGFEFVESPRKRLRGNAGAVKAQPEVSRVNNGGEGGGQ
jgi:hypothetical protein